MAGVLRCAGLGNMDDTVQTHALCYGQTGLLESSCHVNCMHSQEQMPRRYLEEL